MCARSCMCRASVCVVLVLCSVRVECCLLVCCLFVLCGCVFAVRLLSPLMVRLVLFCDHTSDPPPLGVDFSTFTPALSHFYAQTSSLVQEDFTALACYHSKSAPKITPDPFQDQSRAQQQQRQEENLGPLSSPPTAQHHSRAQQQSHQELSKSTPSKALRLVSFKFHRYVCGIYGVWRGARGVEREGGHRAPKNLTTLQIQGMRRDF